MLVHYIHPDNMVGLITEQTSLVLKKGPDVICFLGGSFA